MTTLEKNLRNRKWILDRIKAEIVGPDPPLNYQEREDIQTLAFPATAQTIEFSSYEEFNRPKIQNNGEEILHQDSPSIRYGAGMLFPAECTDVTLLSETDDDTYEDLDDHHNDDHMAEVDQQGGLRNRASREMLDESDDYDVNLANAYKPSAMGLSFLADIAGKSNELKVAINFAYYKKVKAHIVEQGKREAHRDMWFRIPCVDKEGENPVVFLNTKELMEKQGKIEIPIPGFVDKGLHISVVTRKISGNYTETARLVTICLVNRKNSCDAPSQENTFYQCGFKILNTQEACRILPYPEAAIDSLVHEEEHNNRLLYRDKQTYAIGHGCATSWEVGNADSLSVTSIATECLPSFETPSISPVVKDGNGKVISVSMHKLAGLNPENEGFSEIEELLVAYESWINNLADYDARSSVPVPEEQRKTAARLIGKCRVCLDRIRDGLKFLKRNDEVSRQARKAFKLANHAMYIVQLRNNLGKRRRSYNQSDLRYEWDIDYPEIDMLTEVEERGYWRPFQIAFLLQTIRGICEPSDESRNIVDLIWFPTGGGKTEAYLALTAFTIFFHRISGQQVSGADVLMRYTLRLLTAQQFERAGLLFCSMEYIRLLNEPQLGDRPFRLGMWVGGDTSPNSFQEARKKLKVLRRNPQSENPFVLLKCPWCGAALGPQENNEISGYEECFRSEGRQHIFAFKCPDPACAFSREIGLPITVIDEDIYDNVPNLIIGTVDKFAMLAWKPEIRNVFGINVNGTHHGQPPSLIIQDELHLISGPLGSMVGLYETVIEEACTLRTDGNVIKPKIVASTATISRAYEQVKALYARDRVDLFPPSGLEAGDSFFARHDIDEEGNLKPGRLYVGIMAPGHGSQQTTQARIYASLLQYPEIMDVEEEMERDPWWTLLCFYNSLRELGGAATLFYADTQDYLRVILGRHGYPYNRKRQMFNFIELTSRMRDDYIPKAIQELETPRSHNEDGTGDTSVAVCLASNIIEVGIDISRLSLMTIIGQPKTTSQYIQVSSRIGRKAEAPGLVVCVYNSGKPRDRSHYERFIPYHQRLYAQVEPTSVTPFSPPAVERALHTVIIALTRNLFSYDMALYSRPCPFTENQVEAKIKDLLLSRVKYVDPAETQTVTDVLNKRIRQWLAWNPQTYGNFGPPPENTPLMHPAGSYPRDEWEGHSWPVMSSLRNVDASCEAEITQHYNNAD